MCSIEQALSDEWIRVYTRDPVSGKFVIKLGELDTLITCKLFNLESGSTHFDQSYFIQTPQEPFRYSPSINWHKCPGEALRIAINSLTDPYEAAIEEGYKPEESWLVLNTQFPGKWK